MATTGEDCLEIDFGTSAPQKLFPALNLNKKSTFADLKARDQENEKDVQAQLLKRRKLN